MTDENRYEIAVSSGVVLSIVGFVVSGQFVSAPALEVPYYVIMLGMGVLKSKYLREAEMAVNAAPAENEPDADPVSPFGPLRPAAYDTARPFNEGRWTPQRRF